MNDHGTLVRPLPPRPAAGGPRRIAMLLFAGAEMLDAVAPLEVFASANAVQARAAPESPPPYRVELLGSAPGPVATASGLKVWADRKYADAGGPFDTLLVAGGGGVHEAVRDTALLAWLSGAAAEARRFGSICSGAYLLAAAGLLSRRRAATHWLHCDALARLHPDVAVDSDAIYVRDGRAWTSAGITAGMDMALAMVEEDCGRPLALAVARRLVMFLKRPGGQSQFSMQLAAQTAGDGRLAVAQQWVVDDPAADLSVAALAERAAMSPRSFARAFLRETGVTPARWVEQARLEAARRMLEQTAAPLETVASRCGFGTAETLRRAFQRRLGVAPSEYRARFRPSLACTAEA